MTKHFLFCGPSGSGKTSIVKYLLAKYHFMRFSISATTRPKRAHETEGQDYYFMTIENFRNHIEQNHFVEWEQVYEGRYYGTLKSEIERIEAINCSVVFDVDVEGGLKIKQHFGSNLLAVFIRPPSAEDLRERLIARNTETAESLEIRLNKSIKELEYENRFDNIIINDDLEQSCLKAEVLVNTFLSH
ncbi:MAG: guanylate kinase [Bacteroidetes bacterium]|jgi:guanylate kinase|nr:guanylate kinase [Bacteroidota bacterium]MBX7238934.1 guanylate kinase [Bacteroidia bacterium]MCC7513316.1 guanylate kinase [Bacteroidia bacterium]MCW5919386.1 guanylate kinase [Bacteroidota bacterium]HCI58465.1 guanylate kinase [Bacteroidota bacterium]